MLRYGRAVYVVMVMVVFCNTHGNMRKNDSWTWISTWLTWQMIESRWQICDHFAFWLCILTVFEGVVTTIWQYNSTMGLRKPVQNSNICICALFLARKWFVLVSRPVDFYARLILCAVDFMSQSFQYFSSDRFSSMALIAVDLRVHVNGTEPNIPW